MLTPESRGSWARTLILPGSETHSGERRGLAFVCFFLTQAMTKNDAFACREYTKAGLVAATVQYLLALPVHVVWRIRSR